MPPPLLCSLPPPPAGVESSAAASARSYAELAEDAAAGLQAHGGRTELRQRRTTDATARLPVADGRDRALLPPGGCLRLPRDGRPIRPKPAVFGSRWPSLGERASSPPRLARPARAPKALLAVASSGATPVVGKTPEGMGRERERVSLGGRNCKFIVSESTLDPSWPST